MEAESSKLRHSVVLKAQPSRRTKQNKCEITRSRNVQNLVAREFGTFGLSSFSVFSDFVGFRTSD
jgi:hypothetical protein